MFGLLNFEATLLDSRFTDPQGQKFSVDFDRDGWSVNLGDIQGSLVNTNRFASFSRSLRGAQVGYKQGAFQAKVITSQAKARAETVSIPGNGSSGPYYLQSSQIVPESERVQVDGELLVRGQDYSVSYEIGAITFTTRVVSPSSSIVVTFEAFGTNSRRGTIDGAGASYDMKGAGRIGITAMRQKAQGESFGSTRLEKFFGFGPPSTPYVLQFEPLPTRPITIRVNGTLQFAGVDYNFDPDNTATFFFTRFMPPTDEIDVVYTPRPRQTVDGDREVVGLDYRLPLGRNGAISYAQAFGRLTSEAGGSSGLARGATLDYATGPWTLRANARDIPSGYVSVETLSFNRNERAHDINLGYQPDSKQRFNASQGNSVVTTRRVASNGDVSLVRSRVTNSNLNYALTPSQNGQPLRLAFDRRQSSTLGNPSKSDTLSVSTNREFKAWDYRLSAFQTNGSGPESFAAGAPIQSFSILGLSAALSFRPSSNLLFDAQSSINAVRSGEEDGTGRRHDLTISYLPTSKLTVSGRYSDNDSGGVAGLGGFNDGTGIGFDGSGFSSGQTGINFLGATGSRLINVNADYRHSQNLSMTLDAYTARYTGSVTSNSETKGYGFTFFWAIPRENRLSLRFDNSTTTFIESDAISRATTVQLGLDGRLSNRFSYQLRASTLLTGGTSPFQQNGLTFESALGYRLSSRQNLVFELINGSTTGYLPQGDLAAALIYQYQLLDSIALNAGYRYRNVRNRDASSTSGAYRSGSFDLELSFQFPR